MTHPKFAKRLAQLTTPYRIPTAPTGPVRPVTLLVNLNVLNASQEFWDQEFEQRLKEYRETHSRK